MPQILSQRTPATHRFGLLFELTKSPDSGLQAKSDNPITDCDQTTAIRRLPIRALLPLSAALVLCVVFSISQSVVAQSTFTNPTPIADFTTGFGSTPASPYPSNIAASGLPGSVTKVTVTLNNLNFGTSSEADILLVGPNGQSVILMSDAPGDATGGIINMTLTFDDAAISPLPSVLTSSGSYKPTNFEPADDFFPAPAPVGPYGTTLSVFNGTNPNGIWSLYMVDDNDAPWDYGGEVISGGWSLTLTASTQPVNPIDEAQFFVRQHYLDFINREPDSGGLAFWTNEITLCGTNAQCIEIKRINVSAAFYLSIEFQGTGYLVERIYKAAYGDGTGMSTFGGSHQLPVPVIRLNEFLPDTQEIGNGLIVGQTGWEQVLENNKQTFTSDFVQRSRFTTAFPTSMTPAQFVDTLNANAGGPLSQSERDQLVSDLSTGAKTRAQVLRAVAEDPDLNSAEFNRAFVLMQYFGYLRRNPNDPQDTDYTGYDFWLTKLNQFNGNYIKADMVQAFIVSGEYRGRFGS